MVVIDDVPFLKFKFEAGGFGNSAPAILIGENYVTEQSRELLDETGG